MGSYYYLMAQLPFLIYEQKPHISSGAFKSMAESLMDKEDSKLMDYLSLDPSPLKAGESASYMEAAPSTGCDFIDGWREWERTLRLNLAKHRAIHIKRDNTFALEPPFMPVDAVAAALKAVTGDSSPLDAEILIDKARWNAIDTLAGKEYFTRNSVYAYFLKLLLIERRQAFNTDKGFSEYKSLYAEIIESAHNSLGVPK